MPLPLGTSSTGVQGVGAQPTSTKSADVVALLNADTLEQILEVARPLAATVDEQGQLMRHPLEDGATIVDHFVINPTEITFPVTITGDAAVETFETLRQTYLAGTVLTVLTRARSYTSMIIEEMPHDETPEAIDTFTVQLRLVEAKFVKAIYGGLAPKQVKAPAKASTVKRGDQQTTKATAPQEKQAGDAVKGSHLHQWIGSKL